MGDFLYDPLGRPPAVARRMAPGLWIGCATAAVAIAAGVCWFALHRSPAGKSVVAVIEAAKPAPQTAATASQQGTAGASALGSAGPQIVSASAVDQASGVSINRPNGLGGTSATIIKVPEALQVALAPAPDPRLVERSRYGLLPRRGADGTRPADAYAGHPGSVPPDAPRLAIVIGAMGLDATATANASANLPPAVTFAFAPYGEGLDAQAQVTRDAGHEAILQVPMQGTADRSSLSHLLTLDAGAGENLDRLHWHMGRFTGYVAVANYLGGLFTGDDKALAPVLTDLAARGLFYFDDGTAPRSVAGRVAASLSLPIVKADTVIDAGPDRNAVDAALQALVEKARKTGSAIGFANGRPDALPQITRFASQLADQGVWLVPLSSLISSRDAGQTTARP